MNENTTIGTRHLRTKIAIGYALILLLVGGIVYIWLSERKDLETLKAENERISDFRKEIHGVYVHIAELSLMGETILEWDDKDVAAYHKQRLVVDTMLCRFKAVYPAERIDSVRRLLEDKEEQLRGIMQALDRQDAINAQIAERVPVIAWKSTQEEPQKPKRKGFLGLFGKKEKPKPTATSTMLYTLNRDMIARQKRQTQRLSEYADSLAARNTELNRQLQRMIQQMDTRVQDGILQREREIAGMRDRSFYVELSIDRSRVTQPATIAAAEAAMAATTRKRRPAVEVAALSPRAVEATRKEWYKRLLPQVGTTEAAHRQGMETSPVGCKMCFYDFNALISAATRCTWSRP